MLIYIYNNILYFIHGKCVYYVDAVNTLYYYCMHIMKCHAN